MFGLFGPLAPSYGGLFRGKDSAPASDDALLSILIEYGLLAPPEKKDKRKHPFEKSEPCEGSTHLVAARG